jgi:hypothetical protein
MLIAHRAYPDIRRPARVQRRLDFLRSRGFQPKTFSALANSISLSEQKFILQHPMYMSVPPVSTPPSSAAASS